MHEISLVEAILDIAFSQAQLQEATQIHQVNLQVGELSGVAPEALQFAFVACTQGTIAAEAKLEIAWIEARCYCPHCRTEFTPRDWVYICPQCDRISQEICRGREFQLVSLEIS